MEEFKPEKYYWNKCGIITIQSQPELWILISKDLDLKSVMWDQK